MSATADAPTVQTLEFDLAAARLVARTWDAEAHHEHIVASVPSAGGPGLHLVRGHSHGRDASCDCWGYRRWKRCKHVASFVLILEELERQFYSDQRLYPTKRLIELLDFYERIPDILNADQRLRRGGIRAALADRGVRYEATRTLAERRRVVERGRAASADLFGDD